MDDFAFHFTGVAATSCLSCCRRECQYHGGLLRLNSLSRDKSRLTSNIWRSSSLEDMMRAQVLSLSRGESESRSRSEGRWEIKNSGLAVLRLQHLDAWRFQATIQVLAGVCKRVQIRRTFEVKMTHSPQLGKRVKLSALWIASSLPHRFLLPRNSPSRVITECAAGSFGSTSFIDEQGDSKRRPQTQHAHQNLPIFLRETQGAFAINFQRKRSSERRVHVVYHIFAARVDPVRILHVQRLR